MKRIKKHAAFGGMVEVFEHHSKACNGRMEFATYTPPAARHGAVPAVMFLSGLTCDWSNFATKAGAFGLASELGIALIMPDTSPRKTNIEAATTRWDLGEGAGFYLDATEEPWNAHFQMERYVAKELVGILKSDFDPIDAHVLGICGHSMGGHGAITLGLRHPKVFGSISAIAPILTPSDVPWGQLAFTTYLGQDRTTWAEHDSTQLVKTHTRPDIDILIDQGAQDAFFPEQLHGEAFLRSANDAGQPVTYTLNAGYDHSYYFVSSMMQKHLLHHVRALGLMP